METCYELRRYKTRQSKKSVIVGYFDTLQMAENAAKKINLYSIREYTEEKNGLISHSYGQYYFKNF